LHSKQRAPCNIESRPLFQPLPAPKDGGQRASHGALEGRNGLLTGEDFNLRPIEPTRRSVETSDTSTIPPGDVDEQSQQHTKNPRRRGRDDDEGHNLSPEGLGPKVFGGVVHDTRFPRHFQALGNIIKYDGKTNPSV
jgi:hypothetical protein